MITNRDSISIKNYLRELTDIPLIKPEEEISLATRIKAGDQAALHKLVKANLRFVITTAKKFQNMGVPFEDLIAEGNVGLIKAASRFDASKGVKFISFAVYYINSALHTAIEQHGRLVRLPVNKMDDITQINKAVAQLEQQYQMEPTDEQVAEFLDVSPGKITESLAIAPFAVSLDTPFRDEQSTLLEQLSCGSMVADKKVNEEERTGWLNAILNNLTGLERQVISLSYGLDAGWEVPVVCTAEMLGVKPTQVYYAELCAMQKLKKLIAS
jgi:RNA polymerase primary sigma factor